jgi:shikimate dehydrogenase
MVNLLTEKGSQALQHVGLIGYPVAHSLSPQMQQAAFDTLGIAARYALWETPPDMLAACVAALRSADVLGANVTIPYKAAIIPMIDVCDPVAARIGAINTIARRDGRLVGYNTDIVGFMQALAEYPFDSQGKKAVILGTGGAARAAAVGLLENGVADLTLLGRTAAHVAALHDHLRALAAARQGAARTHGAILGSVEAHMALMTAGLLINATPVGLKADDTTVLIDVNALPPHALVMDMIFNPPLTPLLQAAQARGLAVLNGLSMLLYQGACAFALWTGCPAPIAAMRRALGLVR